VRALRAFALVSSLALGFEPAAHAIPAETWLDFRFHGTKVGFVHATEAAIDEAGARRLVSRRAALTVVRRNTEVMRIESDTEAVSDPSGRPVRFETTRTEAGAKRRVVGRVDGQSLLVTLELGTSKTEKRIPLAPDLYLATSTDVLFKKDLKVGKRVEGKVVVEDDGDVRPFTLVVTGQEDTKDGRAWVVETTVGGLGARDLVLADGRTVRSSSPQLGAEFVDVPREAALALGNPADIFSAANLKSRVVLPAREHLDELSLRLVGRSGRAPKVIIDDRQRALGKKKDRVEVRVLAEKAPTRAPKLGAVDPKAEAKLRPYLVATPYEPIDDPAIVAAARTAVGDAADVWTAARRINAFVHKHITNKSLAQAFSTATEALQSREGDCTEHAVLFSALAKAVGIPTRLVTGLVYVGGPDGVFGNHAWVEIWVGDRWLAMDPTFGQDLADPTHVKLSQGVSDPEGLRDSGIVAAEMFGDTQLEVIEWKTSSGRRFRP
jgi:hypothetical protein